MKSVNNLDPVVHRDGVGILDSLRSMAERTLAVRKQESEKCYQLIERCFHLYRGGMPMKQTIAGLILKTLAAAGVKQIYVIVGNSLNGLTEALRKQTTAFFLQVGMTTLKPLGSFYRSIEYPLHPTCCGQPEIRVTDLLVPWIAIIGALGFLAAWPMEDAYSSPTSPGTRQ